VEHIFGFIENSMNGSNARIIGIASAEAKNKNDVTNL